MHLVFQTLALAGPYFCPLWLGGCTLNVEKKYQNKILFQNNNYESIVRKTRPL